MFGVRARIISSFLIILVAAFFACAILMTSIAGNYMLEGRVVKQHEETTRLAAMLAGTFAAGDTDALLPRIESEGQRLSGRLMIIDSDGRVQADSLSMQNGERLRAPEIVEILEGAESSYGLHKQAASLMRQPLSWLDFFRAQETASEWVGMFASPIRWNEERIGVMLYIVSVQDMADSLIAMQDQMLLVFIVIGIFEIVMSLITSRIITKPILNLTASIERMSKGDLHTRVNVTGGIEMARLGEAFNKMSEKLEHVDETRNQFVSNASHELKTPLSTMKILIESMIYEPTMEEDIRQDFLKDINKEIDRLTAITSDLLTLVRADSGELKLRRESFRLGEAVVDVARKLEPLANDRDLAMETSIANDIIIFADKGKISQVVYNLLENAIKYTPSGGSIDLTLKRGVKSAVLTVKDTGIGIPSGDTEKVFERFYRVDKARARATGGSGLGLSIVKQIVMLHDGDVSVKSQEGQGSTFTVTLPIDS
jgi:signal transduction histidine kinase